MNMYVIYHQWTTIGTLQINLNQKKRLPLHILVMFNSSVGSGSNIENCILYTPVSPFVTLFIWRSKLCLLTWMQYFPVLSWSMKWNIVLFLANRHSVFSFIILYFKSTVDPSAVYTVVLDPATMESTKQKLSIHIYSEQ